jgi:hypothetical protein
MMRQVDGRGQHCEARQAVPKNGTIDYLRLAPDSGDPMGAFPVSTTGEILAPGRSDTVDSRYGH